MSHQTSATAPMSDDQIYQQCRSYRQSMRGHSHLSPLDKFCPLSQMHEDCFAPPFNCSKLHYSWARDNNHGLFVALRRLIPVEHLPSHVRYLLPRVILGAASYVDELNGGNRKLSRFNPHNAQAPDYPSLINDVLELQTKIPPAFLCYDQPKLMDCVLLGVANYIRFMTATLPANAFPEAEETFEGAPLELLRLWMQEKCEEAEELEKEKAELVEQIKKLEREKAEEEEEKKELEMELKRLEKEKERLQKKLQK